VSRRSSGPPRPPASGSARWGPEGTPSAQRPKRKHEGGGATRAALEALDLKGRSDAVPETHRQVTGDVGNNLPRRDSPRYQAEGWPIGSGYIEAACKTVVNQRLKPSGMRWGCDGADALGYLRALDEDETSPGDTFWEQSIN
jgi:hypothetical protein